MTEHVAKHEIEPRVCPMCAKTLAEGDSEVQDNYLWTDVGCPNCGWKGRQWDEIKFSGFTIYDEAKGETINVEPAKGDTNSHICSECGRALNPHDVIYNERCAKCRNKPADSELGVPDQETSLQTELAESLTNMLDFTDHKHDLDHEVGFCDTFKSDCVTCDMIEKAKQVLRQVGK